MNGQVSRVDEPRAACMNTSSMNSWFRWNLVSASVLVEIISFSGSYKSAGTTKAPREDAPSSSSSGCILGLCWRERVFSVTVSMAHSADKTHSIHAPSRSLLSFLSVPPFEGFHLSVLLSQHRLCRCWTWIPHSNRQIGRAHV